MEATLFNKKVEYEWLDGKERRIDEENLEWIWDKIKDGQTSGEIAQFGAKSGERFYGNWNVKR